MKVLEKGSGQTGWAIKHKCTGSGNGEGGCGALLLIEAGDLYTTTRSVRDETDYFTTFTCLECGVETDIDDSRVSGKLLTEVRARKQPGSNA